MIEQLHIAFRNADKIDPKSIGDYIGAGGYTALEKARSLAPKELADEVKKANLRGRGGAGFNAGLKWGFVPADAETTYVVCNLDEGEPGTYKDRLVVEKDPHSLLEGMAICAWAVRSRQGYIYCRGEYPYIVDHLNGAIAQAEARGVLGDFKVEVRMGAGAYVCGEESALIESIEGHRGLPRYKPPFPGANGVWGRPTVVHNVETLVALPEVVSKGADWYAAIGASNYPGTKVLTLTGDVVNRQAFEVPTDVTLRQVIFELGGGVRGGRKFKAVQVGGTSGGFIPESYLDTPIDFDSMRLLGSFLGLGTGAVFVLDETRDMVDVATRVAKFFEHESCGKCTPCREGTYRMYEIMKKINRGDGTDEDLDRLESIGKVMLRASLCGSGQASPSPILTAIRYFRSEFDHKLKALV
jgi:NADH-quinone oxidoreductase subunit F